MPAKSKTRYSVSTWGSTPYVYVINSLDNLYYANLYKTTANVAPWNVITALSDWTFVTNGAKQISVGMWGNNPYLYLINTNNEFYYGYLYTETATVAPWNTYTVFSGWTYIISAAKTVTIGSWQGNPYIYLTNSLDDLYFGNLYKEAANVAPWTVYTLFSGWHPFS